MTKFQKKMLTIAAAGAISAVTALPAMALENQFSGSFNVRWDMSNWEAYENQQIPYNSQVGTLSPYAGAYPYMRNGVLINQPATALAAAPYYSLANGLAVSNAIGSNTAVVPGRAGFSAQRYYYPASNPSMSNYFEQRAVLQYSAKASEKLKLVTAFEIDSRWGDSAYSQDAAGQTIGVASTRNTGGGIGADKVNLETKNVYLDFVCPLTDANVKVGIQPFADQFKGVFLGPVDMAGINIKKKMGAFTGNLGFFRMNDQIAAATSTSTSNFGRYTRDLYMLDGAYAINKDLNVGLTYYYHKDNTSASTFGGQIGGGQSLGSITNSYNLALHTVGLRTDAKFGKFSVDGAFLVQAGNIQDNPITGAYPGLQNNETVTTVGFAAQAGAKYTTDSGQFKMSFLWTSGDNQANDYRIPSYTYNANGTMVPGIVNWNNPRDTKRTAFINVQSQTRESVYTGLTSFVLLNSAGRFGGSDRAVAPDMYNFGQGVTAGAIGYDAKLGKGYVNTNVVALASTANNSNDIRHINKLTLKRNNSRYMGTEINIEPGYKLYDNLTIYTQFAYAFLGDYFKNSAGNNGALGTTTGVPTPVYNAIGAMAGFPVGYMPMSLVTTAKTPTDPYTLRVGLTYSF